ncbi:cysteine and histidine-rich domain-containing protein RAR1-like [Capsicum annuum]|nr:cysteine and histidine-rich domain-containing protein RAR1-like [Capsicum annuum]
MVLWNIQSLILQQYLCQRCDVYPIGRIPLPKDVNKLRLRLYFECIEAGLISKKCDDRLQEKKDREVTGSRCGKSLLQKCRTVDPCGSALPQTLHSQKTNVTDVCMDESVVSSDPIIAFFLDEVVVKDWHKNFESWRALIRERKSAAIKRAWPDSVSHFDEYNASTLFIEDALSNIEAAEQGDLDDHEKEMALAYLQKDGGSLYSRSKIQEMAGCYPFESLRATADILFLRGSSDFVVAKQAIVSFLLDEGWRHIIDDFSATFGATKHSSFLDDEGVPALKEASQLLPKISSPTIHPKVAQVLGIEKNGYLRAYGPGKSITEYFSGRPTKIQLIKQVESIRKKSNEHVEKVKREAKEESEEMKKEMEDKIAELDKR